MKYIFIVNLIGGTDINTKIKSMAGPRTRWGCVILVPELRKCVIPVLKLYSGLIFIQTGIDRA